MAEPGVFAKFMKHAVLMTFKSHQEGRPIYEDQVYIEIRVAGVEKDIVHRKATQQDKERFAEEWARFEAGESQGDIGTRIEMWPALTPAMVKNLQNLNIFTVEAMADLSDAGCQKVGMGAIKLRDDARKYLNNGTESGELKKLAENQAKVIEEQGKQLALLQQQMDELLANTPAATPPLPVKPGAKLAKAQ